MGVQHAVQEGWHTTECSPVDVYVCTVVPQHNADRRFFMCLVVLAADV